jgi:hypothetical protein
VASTAVTVTAVDAYASCVPMTPAQQRARADVIFDGVALNVTVVSYLDKLDVGIVGDAAALSDAWELIEDVRGELAAMEAAAGAAALRS